MPEVTQTKDDNLRYTLSPTRQELVYQKLVDILPADLSAIFLKPAVKGRGISWSIEDDSLRISQIIPYSKLPQNEQGQIIEKLNSLSIHLPQLMKGIPELKGKVNNIYDLPDMDSVKLLKTNKGDRVVITDWAHVKFDRARGYNPFEKIIKNKKEKFPVKLRFIFSDGVLFVNQSVNISYRGLTTQHTSNDNGIVDLGKLPTSSHLSLSYKDQENITRQQEITTIADQEYYEIIIPLYTSLSLTVKDQNENLLNEYPVKFSLNGTTQDLLTNDAGIISLNDLVVGKNVQIFDGKNTANSIQHTLLKKDNDLELAVNIAIPPPPPPPPKLEYLSFFIYDYNKDLLKDASISISQKQKLIDLENDGNGKNSALKKEFILNQKAKAFVEIEQKGKKKKLKHDFKILDSQDEYHLQLKRNYWWFLLLLIPLLLILLLSFDKSVVVHVENQQGQPVADAGINLKYDYDALFDLNKLTFLSNTIYDESGISDTLGNSQFSSMACTVYDRLFSHKRKAQLSITANSRCIIDTSFNYNFYSLEDTLKVRLASQLTTLELKVVNKANLKPIENAQVEFDAGLSGQTDKQGRIQFKNLPVCGLVDQIYASKKDYLPDSIKNKSISELASNIKNRTLYLVAPIECDSINEPGDVKGGEFLLNVPIEDETYVLAYNFQTIEDRIVLYRGKTKSGQQLFDSGWVSGKDTIQIQPKTYCSGCDFITAEILTNNSDTHWDVSFKCPK